MSKIFYFIVVFAVLLYSCSPANKNKVVTKNTCDTTSPLPYTLSHFSSVSADTGKVFMIGGVANDSITSSTLMYKKPLVHIPELPKKLMNGFSFRLGTYMYYGGGYTTNWSNKYTPSLDNLTSIQYASSTNALASGDSGRVFLTTNSGVAWTTIPLNTKKTLLSLNFIAGANTGWVISDSTSSKVFKTTDAGNTWDGGTVMGNANFKSISFINISTGWSAGNSGNIFGTTNGGANWNTSATGSTANLNSIYFFDLNNGWACGDSGIVLKTTNAGANWTVQNVTTNNLFSIRFLDASTGYLSGAKGTLAKTINGGVNWSLVKIESSKSLRSVNIFNSNKAVVCGDKGNLLYTANGTKWERIYGITPNNLNGVSYVPGKDSAVVCGSKGFTSFANEGSFRYKISSSVYKRFINSSDSSWTDCAPLPIPISEVFSSAGAMDSANAYVVGGRTTGGIYSDNIFRYNASTQLWTSCTRLPYPRSYGGLAIVSKDTMLFLGGINSVNITDTLYKLAVNSKYPDSLSITFSAKYPKGAIYAMGSVGIKFRHLGIFSGGADSNFKFYKFNATIKRPYTGFNLDSCPSLDPIYSPIVITPGIYTVNWACPSMPDTYTPAQTYDNNEYYILVDVYNKEIVLDNNEFASCVCDGLRTKDVGLISTLHSNTDLSGQIEPVMIEIFDGSFIMPGGVDGDLDPRDEVVEFSEY